MARGEGSVIVDGRFIDLAVVRRFRAVLEGEVDPQ